MDMSMVPFGPLKYIYRSSRASDKRIFGVSKEWIHSQSCITVAVPIFCNCIKHCPFITLVGISVSLFVPGHVCRRLHGYVCMMIKWMSETRNSLHALYVVWPESLPKANSARFVQRCGIGMDMATHSSTFRGDNTNNNRCFTISLSLSRCPNNCCVSGALQDSYSRRVPSIGYAIRSGGWVSAPYGIFNILLLSHPQQDQD